MSKREVMDQFKEDVALAIKRNKDANITIDTNLVYDFDSLMQSEAWRKFSEPIPIQVREHYSDKEVQKMYVQSQTQAKQSPKEPTTLEEVEATIDSELAYLIKRGICNPDDPEDIRTNRRLILVAGCKKAGIPVPLDPPVAESIADRLGGLHEVEDLPHEPSDPDVSTMYDEDD